MRVAVVNAWLRAGALAALLATAASAAQSPDAGRGLSPYEARAREIFARVIGFRTSVGLGQVPAMADYLAGEFRAAGFPDADIHIIPLGETASMVVRYRGDGSGGKPILLMAHMDVVTAKREDWQRDPFTLVEENGFFYGRGTFDIKGSLTCLTATFLRLKAQGFVPTRDLVLVFTGDEEVSQDTMQDLVQNHRELLTADFALNTDAGYAKLDEATGLPSEFGIETAEKTYASYELTVHNPGGHSMQPRPDNAIYELADALKKVQAYRFPVMWNDTTLAYFKGVAHLVPGKVGRAMKVFAANPHEQSAAMVLAGNQDYAAMTHTTCVPTLLRGGHAENALPESATATINCRIFPGIDPAAIRDKLLGIVGPGAEVTTVGTPRWSEASPLRADVLGALTRTVHALYPGILVLPRQDNGVSDNVFTRAAGIPSYGTVEIFIKPSDDFMHGLNERAPVKSFYDGLKFWYLLLKDLAGPPALPAP